MKLKNRDIRLQKIGDIGPKNFRRRLQVPVNGAMRQLNIIADQSQGGFEGSFFRLTDSVNPVWSEAVIQKGPPLLAVLQQSEIFPPENKKTIEEGDHAWDPPAWLNALFP